MIHVVYYVYFLYTYVFRGRLPEDTKPPWNPKDA